MIRSRAMRAGALWLLAAALPALAAAEEAPPRHAFTLGGEATATLAADDRGFFNYTDYDRSALRLVRLSLAGEARLGSHLALLGELRSENLERPHAYALYARWRPWTARAFDVQAGIIPPVFGSFPRRRYGTDNPLIGYPLAYQYLTSWRPDSVPATADDLLRYRGDGWLVRYPVGDPEFDAGMPLVSAFRWDTGVEVRLGDQPLQLSAAVTMGTLGNPRVRDDNDGRQVSAHLAWRPGPALLLGASAARGAYLDRDVQRVLPGASAGDAYRQDALGLDLECSAGYWLARAEGVWTAWDAPAIAWPTIPRRLRARALMLEGRYRVAPGAHLALRLDHLGFSPLAQGSGGPPLSWDARVWRVELGGAYAVHRQATLKAAYQHNWRDGGPVREQAFLTGQVLLWF
jgi:hypothetical protein